MLIDYAEFAKKYHLDNEYVATVFGACFLENERHIDASKSPYYLYDEDKALDYVLSDMDNQASFALKGYEEWRNKYDTLEAVVNERRNRK